MRTKTKIKLSMLALVFQVFLSQGVEAIDITSNTTINTNTTYGDVVIKNGATLTLDATLTVTGSMTIESGGILTHSVVSSSSFNLLVDGTLEIESGGAVDMSGKGISKLGASGNNIVGGTYGGQGRSNSDLVYGDIYNPLEVGSYGRNTGYPGGGLVRMSVGVLINNGSILSNGTNGIRGRGSGGSINITVNGNLSGVGIYEVNGGDSTNSTTYYDGGGGRIAIKYGSVSNLTTLRSNISAKGPANSGEGTIYIKNNTSGEEYLIIKGDAGSLGTTIDSVDLNVFEEVEINNAKVTITEVTGTIDLSSNPDLLNLSNNWTLIINDAELGALGNLNLDGGNFTANSLTVNGTLSNIGTTVSLTTGTISGDLIQTSGIITLTTGTISGDLNQFSGTINSTSLNVNGNVDLGGIINNTSTLDIGGDMTILNGGVLTHSVVSSSSFNLLVAGILDVQSGGSIDMTGKGISTLGAGGYNVGGTHGGQGRRNGDAVYGDIYNPISVGSYGRNTGYSGGGLVRMTVGTLINNGEILASGTNGGNRRGSGGSINITVNGNLSGVGIYEANGGEYTYNSERDGGGGRIAIKYGSISDLSVLRSNISAKGPGVAGEGTIYIKDNTSLEEYLIIKGDAGTYGTIIDSIDLNVFEEVEINDAKVTITELTGTIDLSSNSDLLNLSNSWSLVIDDDESGILGDLNLEGGNFTANSLTVNGTLSNSGTTLFLTTGIISGNLTQTSGTINLSTGTISGDLNQFSGTINSTSLNVNGNVDLGGIINNTSTLDIGGDMTILNGGVLTHSVVSSSSFNLLVAGILDVQSGGSIDMTGKGISTLGAGGYNVGGTHGGQGRRNGDTVYGDIYNPISVGSYGRNTGYSGGGLVRMTVGTLINNGEILASGTNGGNRRGSGGSINITVNGNLSGVGIYEANGGEYTYNSERDGGGGRIAIKYGSISDLSVLRSNISAKGPGVAGEGTIYIKDNTSLEEYLIIKGDAGTYGTIIDSIDLNVFEEVEINDAKVTITELTGTIDLSSNSDLLNLSNSWSLVIDDDESGILGDLNLEGGNFTANSLTVNGTLSNSGTTLFLTTGIISGNLTQTSGTINLSTGTISGDLNQTSGTINSTNLGIDGNLNLGGTVNNTSTLDIGGDMTIVSGGILTHPAVSSSSFNLLVDGTLEIESGGSIDMTGKGESALGAGGTSKGGTYGGQGYGNTKAVYGDIYNPLEVGSYGRNISYKGGGLVRMTVGTLVNNGSILANGTSANSYSRGSGGSINITVNNNLSGIGVYEANGGDELRTGGGGRIAIKYGSVSDLNVLRNNISAKGPLTAGEGTIYIKDNTSGEEYLIIKGDGGDLGTTVDSIDLNVFEEVEIDNAKVTITEVTQTMDLLTNPDLLILNNNWNLIINDSNFSINGDLNLEGGEFIADALTVIGNLSNSGTTVTLTIGTISGDLNQFSGTINLSTGTISGNLNQISGTINSTNLGIDGNLNLGGTVNNTSTLDIGGDMTIVSGGILTHPAVSSSSFNLLVDGTLEIESGGSIDMTGKGESALGAGGTSKGGTYGGQGYGNTKAVYGDIYNPLEVGSYGRNISYKGGGLVRMTVGTLVNNGSILANGTSANSYSRGSGGSINITVNNNLSGIGVYEANGGDELRTGGGGRIAIKYGSVSDLNVLRNNISAKGPLTAGEGTIYIKDNTSGEEYLIIKGDGGDLGTTVDSIDLNVFEEVEIDNAKVTITEVTQTMDLLTNPDLLILNNNWNLIINDSNFSINGDLNLEGGEFIADALTVIGNLSNSGTTVTLTIGTISGDLNQFSGTINLSTGTISGNLNQISGTINSTNLGIDGNLNLGGTVNNTSTLDIGGDMTIVSGGILTHPAVSSSSFNLLVDGTLEIESGGSIDMTGKGESALGAGGTSKGGTYGGQGYGNTKAVYGDIYNPLEVGSYGRNISYKGGGLVRMTVGTLVNNGSILANGTSANSYSRGSGGSINITVNNNLSGIGVYEANGGDELRTGGGGRIAIKYGSVSDLNVLRNNISAKGPLTAGEGTIYLKDNTNGEELLLIKGDGTTGLKTGVGNAYTDYYFATIEVTDGARLYKIEAEEVYSDNCMITGDPTGEIDPNIHCDGNVNFRYYDLIVLITNFSLQDRKYNFTIDGPEGGATLMGASNGVLNGNGTINNRIKFTRLGTYTITFDIYDGNSAESQIIKTASKTVTISAE